MCLTLGKAGLKQTCRGQFIRVAPARGCETLAMLFLFPGLNTSESVRLQKEVHCDPAVNLEKAKPTNDHLKCTSFGRYKCFGLGGNEMCSVKCCCMPSLCPTPCDSLDCSPPGSSVHVILQARVLE